MGGKNSKGPSEAEQRRALQLETIQVALTAAQDQVHFENLVFEGSGNKAVSYYGALKVLEQLGMLAPIHRFAGVGAGAGWAMLLAIGLSPMEIADLNLDNELSYHANFGMFAMLPNLAQKMGWTPLGRAVKIVQRVLEQRTNKPGITFKEVLDLYERELCIVATNLTTGSLEYFHPKTTPDVPIVDALVMSATLPGIMKPKYLMRNGQKHYFVDGGVLCNYPIHVFDGWYLSLKKEDSFLSRLSGNLEPPFKGYNDKTLGIMTVSPGDGDFGEKEFLQRLQYEVVERPNTKLARSKGPESESRYQRTVAQDQVQSAGQRLLERLRQANITGESQLTAADFQRALGEDTGPNGVDDIKLLFGKTREELTAFFEQLNEERDGKLTFDEFVEVAQQQSGGLRKHVEGGGTTRNIRNMPDIFRAVLSAVEGNSKRAYLKEIDIIRTIGVNTDYVGSLDPLGHNDKNFLVVQGEAACLAFFLDYTQRFAPEQTQMPIYSALPQRQISHQEASIDPLEMAMYTVPTNLYPTLPPSYESAIGQSDHLRDTLETNWPQPVGGDDLHRDYDYHPEKRPLVENQLYPQLEPQASQMYSGADPWAIPQASQPGSSVAAMAQAQPQRGMQQGSAAVFTSSAGQSEVVPQCRHKAIKSSQITIKPNASNPSQYSVSISQPDPAPSPNMGGVTRSTQLVLNDGSGNSSVGSGSQFQLQPVVHKRQNAGGQVKGVRFQQEQSKHQQPITQQQLKILQQPIQHQQNRVLQFKQQPMVQQQPLMIQQPQRPQQVVIQSPVRQPLMMAPGQAQQHRLVIQQPNQKRHQRQLAAVKNNRGEISHYMLVS